MKFSILTFASAIAILFYSCRKDVPAGQIIRANGVVMDSVKNKVLPHAKIYLYGAHNTFYGNYYDVGPLDSAESDNNGKFSIQYTAAGNSIDYALSIGDDFGLYSNNNVADDYVMDMNHPIYKFNFAYQLANVTLLARELNYGTLHLKVLSNPYDTFQVYNGVNGYSFLSSIIIKGQSIDTVIHTRILPDADNYFYYTAQSFGHPDSTYGYLSRRVIDTIHADLTDTFRISKTFNSVYDMPLNY